MYGLTTADLQLIAVTLKAAQTSDGPFVTAGSGLHFNDTHPAVSAGDHTCHSSHRPVPARHIVVRHQHEFVDRDLGRVSGPLRTRDQRKRLVISRSPSAGHHHHRRRHRRRADTRQPTFVEACHCCSSAHLNRSRRLVIIDIVCARHIRTYNSVALSQSLTEAGTHSSQRTRRNIARRCKVLRQAQQLLPGEAAETARRSPYTLVYVV